MNELEILQEARKLIEDPECWIKGEYWQVTSRGFTGAFCMFGAIRETVGRPMTAPGYRAVDLVLEAIPKVAGHHYDSVVTYNDLFNTTHTDVMRVFDLAIETAKKEAEEAEEAPERVLEAVPA